MSYEYTSYVKHKSQAVGFTEHHRSEEQAREWIASEREEYGERIEEAIVQRREVGPWETLPESEEL